VSVAEQSSDGGVTVTAPTTVSVPGPLPVSLAVAPGASEDDLTGFVVLTRGADVRRIPYWVRIEAPKLPRERHVVLSGTGVYRGDTSKGQALVSTYRYPEASPSGAGPVVLAGPEQVFRYRLRAPAANLGAVVVSAGAKVRVRPRLVFADDENRLLGDTAYPVDVNPYERFGALEPVVGAIRPAPGEYDVVFDTTSRAEAGPFMFRFWVNDVTPPTVRLVRTSGAQIVLAVTDAGSGVDPRSLKATIDGRPRSVRWSNGRATVSAAFLGTGTHQLVFTASDYQEAKNMENTGPLLPNTRTLRTSFVVR
jgi:hypothetical protein